MMFGICLCILVLSVGEVSAVYKRWLPDTNFDNPANWNVKRTPCGNDVIIIPEDSPAVYIQFNTTIKEMLLPKNAELVLGDNMGLGFTDSPVAGCEDAGGDVEFTAVHPQPWLNPSSWCTTDTERGGCDVTQMRLDVEKVPCTFDDVIFPRGHSYFVDLSASMPKMTVKSMKISGTSFTTSTLTTYFSSQEGQRMFKLPGDGASNSLIDISRRDCSDKAGCACGNDRPEIAAKICAHVEKTCTRPRCKNTIQPVGACCRMCGAIFNVTKGYGFDLSSFTNTLKTNFFSADTRDEVNMTVSVTSEGWVQVVLTDMTGQKSAGLAQQIKADMDSDLADGGHKYAIDTFRLSLSTGSPIGPSPSAHTGGSSMGGGSIAGIVIGLIILLIIVIVVVIFFVFRKTGRELSIPKLPAFQRPHLPTLPRLPHRTPRATARVPPGVFSQPQTAPHIDPGFANPLYDTSPFDDGNEVMKEMELMDASKEEQPTFDISEGGFNNPLYGSQGVLKLSDPSKVSRSDQESPSPKDKGVAATVTSGASPIPASATGVIIAHDSAEGEDSNI